MHVGIVCDHSDPSRGGAERYLARLRARLELHGHTVTTCARRGPHAVPTRASPPAFRPSYYARAFLPRLRDAGAEVILATVPVPGCDVYQPHHGIYAAAIPAHLDPVAWGWRHLRRVNPYRAWHFSRLRLYEARVIDKAWALSPRIVRDIERFYPGTRVPMHRAGVDLRRFAPAPPPSHDPVLLFVAHNRELKGLKTALRALDRLPSARLIIAGAGRSHGRVEYRPFAPGLYHEASVLVHPTYYDTASLVVLEALASGRPAITTVRDGNADLAVEGGGAALAAPDDDAALAREVVR
ncbi:MAG: glycosyltransferase family 4 protein, partial [Planctomycetota bacterium]|nr:glycosyltransferase family 4 protein [Planctomycetota bacterium]